MPEFSALERTKYMLGSVRLFFSDFLQIRVIDTTGPRPGKKVSLHSKVAGWEKCAM